MSTTQVLIVDDSATIRSALKIMIRRQEDMEVVATAGDGAEGVRLAEAFKPDIILMDIEMPVMTGIEAVREIMKKCPTPVLIFSSIAEESAPATLEALEAGAIDFVTKGSIDSSIDIGEIRSTLLTKIREILGTTDDKENAAHKPRNVASTIVQNRESFKSHLTELHRSAETDSHTKKRLKQQIDRIDARVQEAASEVESDQTLDFFQHEPLGFKERSSKFIGDAPHLPFKLIAIGCSTGGPQALHTLLSRIPANFPFPVVVVQHMPQAFIPTFAQRLDRDCQASVVVAKHGAELRPKTIYIAPGNEHLRVTGRSDKLFVQLSEEDVPNVHHKPSVDVMFDSIHKSLGGNVLGAVLTGMGHDGAEASERLHHDKATLIAQNEATCVVYGMPRAVVENGSADLVLPLEEIGDAIVYLTWESGQRFA